MRYTLIRRNPASPRQSIILRIGSMRSIVPSSQLDRPSCNVWLTIRTDNKSTYAVLVSYYLIRASRATVTHNRLEGIEEKRERLPQRPGEEDHERDDEETDL
jgi:hypothetical protein